MSQSGVRKNGMRRFSARTTKALSEPANIFNDFDKIERASESQVGLPWLCHGLRACRGKIGILQGEF